MATTDMQTISGSRFEARGAPIDKLHRGWCDCGKSTDAVLVNFQDLPGGPGADKLPCAGPRCGIGKEHVHCECGGINQIG